MARPSCFDCARKHVGEAEVLMREAECGYPLHAWLAIGHLAQAEAELLSEQPEMVVLIRSERTQYIEGLEYSIIDDSTEGDLDLEVNYQVDTLKLLEELTRLSILSDKSNELIQI